MNTTVKPKDPNVEVKECKSQSMAIYPVKSQTPASWYVWFGVML